MRALIYHLKRAVLRVVPAGISQAQAIAFVMFLSLFPVLLLSLGLLSLTGWSTDPARELPATLRMILPTGSMRLVTEFLSRLEGSPWTLILGGLVGTFLLGTQAMVCYVDGFAIVWRDPKKLGYWTRYRRALLMLCLTIVPWMLTGVLTIFGREVRSAMALLFGGGLLMRLAWTVVNGGAAMGTGLLALTVMYHVARPHRRWRNQLPGAVLAMVLWWLLTAGFSLYVRHMHYNLIYGSMAAVIGLMIWMYFVAMVVMIGAAFNASACGAPSEIAIGGSGIPPAMGAGAAKESPDSTFAATQG
jgi:membrane protein